MWKKGLLTLMLGGAMCMSASNATTLRWGTTQDLSSLDPYAFGETFTLNILNMAYEGLVRYDRNLKIEPALAESYELLDNNTWRFHLRKGVKFHNGADFSADDVLASLTRVSDPTSPLKGNIPAFESASKVDDYTVDIVMNGPYPLMLNDLTNIHIFSKAWLVEHNAEKPTDIGAGVDGYPSYNANGTGPFRVTARQPDAKTVFERFDGYWETPKHNLDKVEIVPITSAATRVSALLSGEINFIDSTPIQDMPRLQAAGNIELLEGTDLRTVMIGMSHRDTLNNGQPNPMQDVRVRQAMQAAIDMDLIQSRVMRGKSRNNATLVAPEIPGYSAELDQPFKYDPEQAKQWLAEAGYPDGFEFDFNCFNNFYIGEEQLCQALASMWSRVGLKPKLDVAPRAVQIPKRTSGKADVYSFGWANEPALDASSFLIQVLRTKDKSAGIFNWGGWSYPELDSLIDQIAVEMDDEKRRELSKQALKIAQDEVIFIPMHQQPMVWAVSSGFSDFPQFPDNKPRLWLVNK